MLKSFLLFICLGFLISCSTQPTTDEASNPSCETGDCSESLNKLAGPLKEQPVVKPTPAKKSRKKK